MVKGTKVFFWSSARAAEKRRKKTRDIHRAQGLEHTKKYRRIDDIYKSKFVAPAADRLVENNNPAPGQKILNIAEAETKSMI